MANTLGRDQQIAVRAIEDLVAGNIFGDRLVISGAAGTGKSFVITKAIKQLGINTLFIASTHPARYVLMENLAKDFKGMAVPKVSTVSSAVCQRKGQDEWGGDVTLFFGPKDKKAAGTCKHNWVRKQLVVVDESSMVNKRQFEMIEQYANHFGIPVIYTGDKYQLPPVNSMCNIFDQGFHTVELLEQFRSPPSRMLDFAQKMREKIINKKYAAPSFTGGDNVLVVSEDDWYAKYEEHTKAATDILAVAYDNATVNKLTAIARGIDEDEFETAKVEVGDRVQALKTTTNVNNGETLVTLSETSQTLYLYFNVEHFYANGLTDLILPYWDSDEGALALPYTSYRCEALEDQTTKHISLFTPEVDRVAKAVKTHMTKHLNALRNFSVTHEEVEDKENTKDTAIEIRKQLEAMDKVGYSYASTVHKAQGRSVDWCFIDTRSVFGRVGIMSMQEKREEWIRLLYVAMTRARKGIIMYETDKYKIGGNLSLLDETLADGIMNMMNV